MSNTQANKDLVTRFVAAGNERDMGTLDEILTDDFTRHCPATPDLVVNCPEDFKEFLRQDAAAHPDSHVTVEHLIAEGDLVAVWAKYSATQEGPFGPFPASGKFCSTDFGGVFRVQDGQIAELWVTWDNLSLLIQLGHIDPPGAAS